MNGIFQQPLLTTAMYRPRKYTTDWLFAVDIFFIHSGVGTPIILILSLLCNFLPLIAVKKERKTKKHEIVGCIQLIQL